MVLEFDIAAPRQMVWEYWTAPGQRPKWRAADEVIESSKGGRRGVGTTNHCMHGAHAIIEEILDWRPFDYLTLSTLVPVPKAPKIIMTYAFLATSSGGTRVELRVARPRPRDRAFVEHVCAEFQKTITSEVAALRLMIEGQDLSPLVVEEPALPAPAERS